MVNTGNGKILSCAGCYHLPFLVILPVVTRYSAQLFFLSNIFSLSCHFFYPIGLDISWSHHSLCSTTIQYKVQYKNKRATWVTWCIRHLRFVHTWKLLLLYTIWLAYQQLTGMKLEWNIVLNIPRSSANIIADLLGVPIFCHTCLKHILAELC